MKAKAAGASPLEMSKKHSCVFLIEMAFSIHFQASDQQQPERRQQEAAGVRIGFLKGRIEIVCGCRYRVHGTTTGYDKFCLNCDRNRLNV